MVSAIVMAGEPEKGGLRYQRNKYTHEAEIYGETSAWMYGYKPTFKITLPLDGRVVTAPAIHFMLTNLSRARSYSEIILQGPVDQLKRDLSGYTYEKPIVYVNQVGNIAESGWEAFKHSQSYKDHTGAAFFGCDIVKVTPDLFDFYQMKMTEMAEFFDLIYGMIPTDVVTDTNPRKRKPFMLIDDYFEKGKRLRGFRPGNVIYANPERIRNLPMINVGYDTRKLESKLNQLRLLFRIAHLLPDFVLYKMSRLSLSRGCRTASRTLGTRFAPILINHSEFESDLDSDLDFKAVGCNLKLEERLS
jgi:hypothetical protein